MAHVDFSAYKWDDGIEDVIQWYVVLLVSGDENQQTQLKKTYNIQKLAMGCQISLDPRAWKIGAISPTVTESQADSFINSLTQETKTRGSSSRSVVFERTAMELGLKVYNNLDNIFKNDEAEELIQRVPTYKMAKHKKKERKRK